MAQALRDTQEKLDSFMGALSKEDDQTVLTMSSAMNRFLSGVGDSFEFVPSRCFISHTWSKGQHDFSLYLSKRLNRFKGIASWVDENEILPGDHIYGRLSQALQKATDTTICVLTPEYLESGNCRAELSKAATLYREKQHRLIPLLLAECDVPLELEGLLFADFRKTLMADGSIQRSIFDPALKRLVEAIRIQRKTGVQPRIPMRRFTG